MTAPAFYYIALTASNLTVSVEVNSFPVYPQEIFPTPVERSIAINQFLQLDNVLRITVAPLEPVEGIPDMSEYDLNLKVKSYEKGEMVGPDTGNIVYTANLSELLTELEDLPSFPITFEQNFKNERFDFSDTINRLKPVTEAEAAEFSNTLIGLLENKDVEGFFELSDLSTLSYCVAFNEDFDQFRAMMVDGIKADLEESPIRPVEEDGIQLISSSDSRIWVPKRTDQALPLLVTQEDETGSFTEFPVMIGKIDGQMQVIR